MAKEAVGTEVFLLTVAGLDCYSMPLGACSLYTCVIATILFALFAQRFRWLGPKLVLRDRATSCTALLF